MSELLRYIDACPLYRRAVTGQDLKSPFVLFCWKKEEERALRWSGRYGTAEAVFHFDGSRDGLADAAKAAQVVVYGKQERRKGLALARAGIRHFLFAPDPGYGSARHDPAFLTKHRDPLERLFDRLEDDESRWTLASVIRHRLTNETGFLRIATYAEYVHPLVKAEPGEVVVDAGAFDGRTSFAFAEAVGPEGRVYGFEPDAANRDLIESLREARYGQVEIVPAALSDRVGEVAFFAGHAGSSGLSGAGPAATVACTTIDGFIAGRRCDLISLDIEGGEPEALAGAGATLRTRRPKLQISVYHHPTHLFDLPLSPALEGYRLFMGHHNTYSTETDVYALAG